MNLNHDFVQEWKFSKNQKKISKWNTFSPNSGEDQKKGSLSKIEHFFLQIQVKSKKKQKKDFHKNRTLFPQIYTLTYCTPIQIIEGDADVDHS